MDTPRSSFHDLRKRLSRRHMLRFSLGAVLAPVLGACSTPMFFEKGGKDRYTVTMTNEHRFDPASIVIPRGAAVVWWNQSDFPQTSTGDPEAFDETSIVALPEGARPWDSGDVLAGAFWSHTFETPGNYVYACRHHAGRGMVGVIRVEA